MRIFLIVLYFSFTVITLYLGHVKFFGDFSLRIPFTIITSVILLLKFRIKSPIFKTFILLVLFYIFSTLISYLVKGENIEEFISSVVLGRFLIALVLIFFTFLIVPKYISFSNFIILLSGILFLNSLVIFGKFSGNDFFWQLSDSVGTSAVEDELLHFERRGRVSGITNIVFSGYFIAALIPLLLLYWNNKAKAKIIIIMLIMMTLFSALIIQQRMAFFLGVFSIVVFYIKQKKNFFNSLLITGFLLMTVFFLNQVFTNHLDENFGQDNRLLNLKDDYRISTLQNTYSYLSDNPILGGEEEFYRLNQGVRPHNIFFNAWLQGGFLGLITVIVILYFLLSRALNIIWKGNEKNYDSRLLLISISLINTLLMSFTHNAGITNGDNFTYIICGLFLSAYDFRYSQNEQIKLINKRSI